MKPPEDSEEKPGDGEEPPTEDDKKPDEGEEPPTEDDKKPGEGEEPPTEDGKKPDEGTDDGEDGNDNNTEDSAAAVGFGIETGSFVMPVYSSENTQDDLTAETLTADGQDAEQVTIENVTWQSDPSYDGDTEGLYLFTPILPEAYALAEDVSLPEIRVSVGCVHGIVKAGEVCPVCELQEQIDALPEAAEVEEALAGLTTGTSQMSREEIDALYELLLTLSDTYDGFPKEWQAMVDAEKLFALLSLFSGEDMLMTTAGGKDVLIFSTTTNNMTSDAEIAEKVLSYVFSEAGYGVQIKCGKKEEQHLTETDMDGIGLLIFLTPRSAPNDTDISLMRDFLAGGGRIVMIGENGRFFAKENAVLSAAAEKLGADFRISDRAIGRECSIVKGTANMPENALTKDVKQSLTSHYVAPIIYTGSAEPVLLLDGQAWMVDQAAGMGRITTLTDINCFDPVRGYIPQKKADTKAWILRWLLDARNNQQMVLSNQDPNLGFGGSPSASVDAKEHVSVLGDYSFTVTYSGSDKSPNSVINETTIGTDDVTVTDKDGASLLINKAQIVSGQGTKKLVVRYTVEAQQSNYFTPGDYTIGINNGAVADKAGKEVGGDPKAAVFRVLASPLQITGPDNLVIPQGGTGSLSVSVSTTDGMSYTYQYQWYQKKNGVYEKVTGATRASYTLPAAVTGVSGEYTYRCEVWASGHSEFRIPSQDALVTVEKGLAIDTPTAAEIAGKDCEYTLSATLLEAGSERIVETGFVWGIMASPTLSLNGGSEKTASPVTAANQKISVAATGLTKTVTYYGRAYVKTAGGNVVYSNAVSFGKTGNMGQFSVKNNGNNTFTVTLANGVGEQMVFYRTVNGSAVGGTHFTHKAGMLTFNGSGSQTVTVSESAVTSTFGGKAATAYSNADRTYSLEIYRPMGGATISAGTATRTMTKNSGYVIDRKLYNPDGKNAKTAQAWEEKGSHCQYEVVDGGSSETNGKNNGINLYNGRTNFSGHKKDPFNLPRFSRGMPALTDRQKEYFHGSKAAGDGWGYRYEMTTSYLDSGLGHIWVGSDWGPGGKQTVSDKNGNSPLDIGQQKFSGYFGIYGTNSFAVPSDAVAGATTEGLQGANPKVTMRTVSGKRYIPFGENEKAYMHFAACGKNDNGYQITGITEYRCLIDTRDPQLVGVAPMAQTAYAIGDNITIALVFDEIVDVTNSTLNNVKIRTNVTNDLSYSGGGNTNVLYFTGKVTTEFKSGDIQVNGITGSSYIKDMCDTSGTETTNKTGSTPITTTGASAPRITLTNNGVTDGYAKAQISAQNATLLQYCWTQDAGMPAAGWLKAGSTTYTATNPAQTAGTYYLHAMAIKQSTGEAAYERTSFTVTPQQQQEQEQKLTLTADTDNSQWARSRTILLEKKGSGTLTLKVKKPDGTTQTVTGNSYMATANGSYVFTLSNGSKSVTKTVTVSKIDRTNPKVTVSAIPTAWQASMPTVTISGTDTNGSGIVSLQYKWVTAKGAYPTSGLTSLGKTGVSVSGSAGSSGVTDGVNYLYYKAVDGVGNMVQGYSSALRLDRITPMITLGAAQVDGPNAIFSVTVKYGPSSGKTTFQKQGDGAAMSVRGSAAGISETTYKYQLKANAGVNEAGSYTFTATSGAGKKATKTAPGIYQITLNAGEGVFESDMRAEGEEPPHTDTWLVVSGGKIVKPTYGAPVREHYTLKGWYTNAACTATYTYDFNTIVTANKTLYAGWTPDSYQITYKKNGGTITNESTYQTYTYSKGLTLPTATQTKRTGYTFDGWYTDEAFADGTKVTKLTATDADDKTFYAKWTANKYTLTYDYQGATGNNDTASKEVTYDAAYGTLPSPKKTGYSFKGWYTQTGGQGSKVLSTTKMTKTQNHKLFAYWVDDLKPDAPVLQDGVTLPAEWTHTQKTIPLTLHDGVGVTELWVSVDSGAYTKVNSFSGQPGNDNYDYVFEGVQEGSHTYRFKAKDAARNESPVSEAFTVKLDTTEAGLTVTGPNAGAEKKTGLVLNAKSGSFGPSGGKLSVKKDGLLATETTLRNSTAGGVLSADHTVKEKGTYHFYSRTNANKADDAAAKETRYVHQVTFDSRGGSAVEPQLVWTSRAADSSAADTVECKVTMPENPRREGYLFSGWYADEACEDENAFDFDTQLYGDSTLFAKWTKDTAPEITAQLSAESAESGWHTEKPQITLTYGDTNGVTRILVSVDGGEYQVFRDFAGGSPAQLPTSGTDTYTDLQEGDHTYTFQAVNTTDLTKETETIRVKLDTVKPALGDVSYNEGYVNLWDWIIRKDSLLVNIPVTEENSGLAKVTYTLTPGSMQSQEPVTKEAKIEKKKTDTGTVYTAVIAIDPDYKGVIGEIQAVDVAGNVSEVKTAYANGIGVIVEEQKPVITVKADRLPTESQAGTKPEGEELSTAYYQTAPGLLVTVQDGSMAASGIKEIKWQIGSGSEHTVSEDFVTALKMECVFDIDGLSGLSGTVQVKITALDNAGNSESKTVTVKIKGKEQTPDASPDYLTEKLTGLLPNADYLIRTADGTEVSRKADAKGEIAVDDGWFGTEIGVIRKGDGINTENSDPQNLSLAARPDAPSLGKSDETIKGKKDGTVTGLTEAMEYSTDGGKTWTNAERNLSDLPAGKYFVRLKAVQTAPHGKAAEVVVGEGRTLTVSFDSQGGRAVLPVTGLSWRAAVKKPVDPTKQSVAFAGWFQEPGCTNRWHFAAEDTADKVEEDTTLYAKWIPRVETPAAVIAYRTETLTGLVPGAVYLIEGKEVTASGDGSVPIDESWFGKTISIIRKGNGVDLGDSEAQLLPVPNRPAGPEQVKPKAESKKNGKNGKLTKTDTTMQYRKKGSTEWISVTGEEVTDLEPGDYELRYVSTDTAFASEIVVKTVKKYSPPKDDGENNGGGSGGNDGGDNGGGNGGDNGGTKPGDGKKPDDGKKTGDGKKPDDSKKPDNGTKPGDGTKTGDDKKPGNGSNPGDDKNPGDNTKPGDDKKPGGKEPGYSADPPIGDEVPKIPVVIEDGKIVIDDSIGAGSTAQNGESTMRTMLQLGDGAIIVTVVCKGQNYTAGVADTVAVANAALTPEQIQLVADGETIEIRVEVTDISESVPTQDKEVIEDGIEAYSGELPGLTLGMYIDISVFIRVGEGDWNAIRKTGEPIDVIIGIPEELQSKGSAYYIIRAHDGECTLLDDTDEAEDTITISSDLFSSYAIAYIEAGGADTDAKCRLCHICPTLLGICYFIWLAVILAVIAIVIFVVLRRRKEEEQEEQK